MSVKVAIFVIKWTLARFERIEAELYDAIETLQKAQGKNMAKIAKAQAENEGFEFIIKRARHLRSSIGEIIGSVE